MRNERELKKVDELWGWLWKKENVRSNFLLPLVVTLLMLLVSFLSDQSHFLTNIVPNLMSFVFEFVLVFFVINIPRFLLDKMNLVATEMFNNMNDTKVELGCKVEELEKVLKDRIDKLPQLMVFHTEGKVFEQRINDLQELGSSPRWIYSKYISKLLSSSFKDAKINFTETAQYSDFSSEIMKECSESVCLTSSMTPYEWLSSLAIDDDEKIQFFNNLSKTISLNTSNHSMRLKTLAGIKKRRIVCLAPFDYDHLFLFAHSFETYKDINEGIETEFCKWNENDNMMKPLQYEYALYDSTLLFRFEKETKILDVWKGNDEFQAVKSFFKKGTGFIKANDLSNKIKEDKQRLLREIITNKFQLPHKYAYLFHDQWTPFAIESERFGQNARNAVADLIDRFDNHFIYDEEIVEIGAGFGDKIDLVCDRIGTDKIASYILIDISKPLMNDSYNLLKKRFEGKKTASGADIIIAEIRFDFCSTTKDNSKHSSIINNKTVLILNNSTLFSEYKFPWEKLRQCKKTIVTLDLFEEENADHIFSEYNKARELLLSPLKIFGIPITKDLVESDDHNDLFSDNRSDPNYSNDNPFYKIYFNLKKYLERINIKVDCDTELNGFDELLNNEKIVILSSLKFKKSYDLKEKIESYFTNNKRFGNKGWKVDVEESEHSADSYVGICIEKTR